MTEENHEPLAKLDERLRRLKDEAKARAPDPHAGQAKTGYGFAFMIATDLVGGLIGGTLLGWGIDTWLGTAPWGMLTFFFVGAAAGMWNVYRTARNHEVAMGFRPPAAPPAPVAGSVTAAGGTAARDGPRTQGPATGGDEGKER